MFDNSYDPVALTRRNNSYIKTFLSNPLTIVLAILYAITGIMEIVSFSESIESFEYMNKSLSDDYGLLVFARTIMRYTYTFAPAILAIGLIALYVQSLDKDPNKAPKVGLGIFLIGAVTNGIYYLTLSCYLFYILIEFINLMSKYGGSVDGEVTTFLLTLIAFTVISIIYAVGFIRFASSIKNSATSPSLFNKGTIGLGVTSLLMAAANIISVARITSNSGGINIADVLGQNSEFTSSTYLLIATYIITGIFAFMYNSHIKKAGAGGVNIPDTANYTTANNFNQASYNQTPTSAYNQQNDMYTYPQSSAPEAYTPEATQYEDYAGATVILSEQPSATMYCPNCGAPTTDEQIFCASCGNKLK